MTRFFLPIYRTICLGIASLAFLASPALAQSTVTVIGPIVPGDCTMFNSTTGLKDGGFPCPGSGGTLNLPNGTTATTQTSSDNSTLVATDAFVQANKTAPGGTSGQVQFNNAGTFGGLTNVQLTALIQQFSPTLSGAVPASGGGTTNFLRADGAFAVPPGSASSFTLGFYAAQAGAL